MLYLPRGVSSDRELVPSPVNSAGIAENYIQNRAGDSALPGALGLGQARATTIFNAFYFFAYLSPVPFALISDAWLGRYNVICISLR